MNTTDYITEKREKIMEIWTSQARREAHEGKRPSIEAQIEAILALALEEAEKRAVLAERERLITSVVTTCHHCDYVVHIFPDDVTKLISLSPQEALPDIHPNACECRVCKGGQE